MLTPSFKCSDMIRLWPGLSVLFLCSLTIGSTRTVPTTQEMVEPPQGPTDETTQPIPFSHILQKDGGNSNEKPNKYLEYQLKSREINSYFAPDGKDRQEHIRTFTKAIQKSRLKYENNLNKNYHKRVKNIYSRLETSAFLQVNQTVIRNHTSAKTETSANLCYFSETETPQLITNNNSRRKTEEAESKILGNCRKSSQLAKVRDKQFYSEPCLSSLRRLENNNFSSNFDIGNETFYETPDNCSYFETNDAAVCYLLKEVPTFNETEKVNYLVFLDSKILTLRDNDAMNLPNSKTLAFMEGNLMRISPGFLQNCQTEELIIFNNHLSSWSFSWFYSENASNESNITSIDLSKNLINLSVSDSVRIDR